MIWDNRPDEGGAKCLGADEWKLSLDQRLVGLLDGAMHVWAVLYRTTRTKLLCMERNHWNQ
jgi:hypothetical protein